MKRKRTINQAWPYACTRAWCVCETVFGSLLLSESQQEETKITSWVIPRHPCNCTRGYLTIFEAEPTNSNVISTLAAKQKAKDDSCPLQTNTSNYTCEAVASSIA